MFTGSRGLVQRSREVIHRIARAVDHPHWINKNIDRILHLIKSEPRGRVSQLNHRNQEAGETAGIVMTSYFFVYHISLSLN
jgi:hypothetical protein